MRYALTTKTAPSIEPVTVAEAKTHSRIDTSAEDSLIGSMITAARQWAESFCQRAFITQTLTLKLDRFPAGGYHLDTLQPVHGDPYIYLPRSPVQSVDEVRYTDTGNTTSTLASSRYRVDLDSLTPRIEPEYDDAWPTPLAVANSVEVEFTAGYGDTADDVPEAIKHAIKIIVATLYDPGRQAVVIGTSAASIPFTAEALLGPYRMAQVPNP